MKKIICLLIAISAIISCNKPELYSPEYMASKYVKSEVRIPMRDGVELFTAIYAPRDNAKHPILMDRTPYGCHPYGEGSFNDFHAYKPYVDAGYILVFQDVRGQYMSGGDFEQIRPFIEDKGAGQIDEASDSYDTIEWLVNNTCNNGCVGVKGISYNGFYATMAALSGHPALKAVSPQAPVTDWFKGDDFHHNGAVMLAECVAFMSYFEYTSHNYRFQNGLSSADCVFPDVRNADIYTDNLEVGGFSGYMEAYGDSLAFLRALREHPTYDQFWEDRTVSAGHLHDVQPAILVVGGLYDKEDCYGAFDTYKSIRRDSPETDLYFLDGPWNHGAWTFGFGETWKYHYFGPEVTSSYYVNELEYPFFAYYLEGKGEKPAAKARVFDSGTRQWVAYEDGWPCVGMDETTPYYLHADGSVSTEMPGRKGVVSYVSDPEHPVPYHGFIEDGISIDYMLADQRFAAQRPDVLCFESEPLEEALTLAGEIEVNLSVDISTTDADFVVKVIDVYPDDFTWESELGFRPDVVPYQMGGYQQLIRGEVMRGKFRENFSDPKPFKAGKVATVRYAMPDVSHTFKPGHKLMIQVQSSWFPLVERNPQTFCDIYTCDKSQYQKATVNVHCEAGAPSFVKLPVKK